MEIALGTEILREPQAAFGFNGAGSPLPGINSPLGRQLQRIADASLSHLTLEFLLPALLESLRDVLEIEAAVFLLLEETGDYLVVRQTLGLEWPSPEGCRTRVPIHDESGLNKVADKVAGTVPSAEHSETSTISRLIVRSGQTVVVEGAVDSLHLCPWLQSRGVMAFLGVPLIVEERVIGVLYAGNRQPRRFGKEEIALAEWAAASFACSIEHSLRFEDVRKSEALKASMLAVSLDGVAVINGEGRILEFNPAACKLFGYPRSQAIGQRFDTLLLPILKRERHWRALQRYMHKRYRQSHEGPHQEGPLQERRVRIMGMNAGGREFPVELALTPLPLPCQTPGEALFMGILRDLTPQERAEVAVQQAQAKTQQAQAKTQQAQTEIQQAQAKTQQAQTEVKQAQTEVQQATQKAVQAESHALQATAKAEQFQAEAEQLHAATQQLQVETTQLRVVAQTSHEQLRALHAHLAHAIEEERSYIARELHDEFGQVLTSLQMAVFGLSDWVDEQWAEAALVAASHNASHTASQREELWLRTENLAEGMSNLHGMVRRIATRLRPAILDDLGLAAAVEWHVTEFGDKTGIACRLVTSLNDGRIEPGQATALFRILQEALTNVARHAEASRVKIQLYEEEGALHLEVRDNGRGIASGEMDRGMNDAKSLGLLGMRERARLLGGDLTITGKLGEGTTLEVWMPAHTCA